MSTLKSKYEELELRLTDVVNEKINLKEESVKYKREINKAAKQSKAELVDIKAEMKRYQSELKKQVEENVKLAEVNKALAEIHKTNEEITKALKDKAVLNQNGSNLSDKNKDALVDEVDEENDAEMEDDEFVAYFARQKEQRTTRTCPTTEATQPKEVLKYTCEICNFETNNNQHLTGHMTRHSHLKCKDCNLQLKTMGLFRRHMETIHKSQSKKDTGNQETTERSTDSSNKLGCDMCSMELVNENHLKRHMMSAHGGDKFIYCTVCDFRSSSQVQHTKHMEVAHSKYCDMCDYKAISRANLEKHIQETHRQQKTKTCEFFMRGNCLYGNQCFFSHTNQEMDPCRYQDACLRRNCPLTHYQNFLESNMNNQDPPTYQEEVWRPW